MTKDLNQTLKNKLSMSVTVNHPSLKIYLSPCFPFLNLFVYFLSCVWFAHILPCSYFKLKVRRYFQSFQFITAKLSCNPLQLQLVKVMGNTLVMMGGKDVTSSPDIDTSVKIDNTNLKGSSPPMDLSYGESSMR